MNSQDELEQLKNSQYNVVDVAEPACFSAFRVMEATRPVDGNVCGASTQLAGSCDGRSGIHTAEIEHVSKDGAVFDTIEVVDQMLHVVLVTGSYSRSKVPCKEYGWF